MTCSVLNQRRRKQRRAIKKAEKRRMRRTEGDWKFHPDPYGRGRPNRRRDTWHQGKEAR